VENCSAILLNNPAQQDCHPLTRLLLSKKTSLPEIIEKGAFGTYA
jgi:hypothetical protein